MHLEAQALHIQTWTGFSKIPACFGNMGLGFAQPFIK